VGDAVTARVATHPCAPYSLYINPQLLSLSIA